MANRNKIYEMTNGKCFYCGNDLDKNNFHMDHFYPKSKNGVQYQNLVPSCIDCNLYKSNLSIDEFREKIEDSLYSTIHGRIINRYYHPKQLKVKFWFEENDYWRRQ